VNDRTERAGPGAELWKLAKPGPQVLADARAQAAQPAEQGSAPRAAPVAEQQNDQGL
jgi:hypothetical protein